VQATRWVDDIEGAADLTRLLGILITATRRRTHLYHSVRFLRCWGWSGRPFRRDSLLAAEGHTAHVGIRALTSLTASD
jgi:hypothetical protein